MYHKHPKRTFHVRKVSIPRKVKILSHTLQPISRIAEKGHYYPKVEMPGSGPVAPPRSSRKRGGLPSVEPSPGPSRTGTLPRKPSSTSLNINAMSGRPLPPPPSLEPKGY